MPGTNGETEWTRSSCPTCEPRTVLIGTDEMIMENAVRPLAGKFQVSPEAMRIRSEGMSLLMRKREASLFSSRDGALMPFVESFIAID